MQGNDACNTAQAIAGTGIFSYDNTGATTGTVGQSEGLCYAFGSSVVDFDVWFEWTSDFTGEAIVETCNQTSIDSKIASYPGGGCPSQGSALACNDDDCQFQSRIRFQASSGTSYMLQIGNFPGAASQVPGAFKIIGVTAPFGVNYRVTYSMNYKGPLHGEQTALGPLLESDMCRPTGGAPGFGGLGNDIFLNGGQLALPQFGACTNPQPGVPCKVEVDAFSRGRDFPLRGIDGIAIGHLFFSVDERARGLPENPLSPSVTTEGETGGKEASADIFGVAEGVLPGPVAPPGVATTAWGNIAVLDGDGRRSASGYLYPGLGLHEPNPATAIPLNTGSNADSLDVFQELSDSLSDITIGSPAFFSLDGDLPDPLEQSTGSDSSAANGGLHPGDILMSTGFGTQIQIFAGAQQLGLDLDTTQVFFDDLDALILRDNGDSVFQPSSFPYQWEIDADGDGIPETDMVIFSVRRGSPIIGTPDSIFGLPICEGDLLIPPVSGLVGASSPGIFVSAEAMGLRADRGSETGSDDVNGADTGGDPFYDCNENGTEDGEDISNRTSEDLNSNGVPDECEDFVEFCSGNSFASTLVCQCPCGNCDAVSLALAGCGNGNNSTSDAGGRLVGSGSVSVTATSPDLMTLTCNSLVPNKPGLYFQGNNAVNNGSGNHFGDGLRCAGGSVIRLEVRMADGTGFSGTTIDIVSKGGVSSGDVKRYQCWYRDPVSTPCGSTFNLTNGVQVVFGP